MDIHIFRGIVGIVDTHFFTSGIAWEETGGAIVDLWTPIFYLTGLAGRERERGHVFRPNW